ncbi:phosphotransferase family protein [Solirubrobacter sp. CPCC 204708]|uniref:Phosphotransferase family protein n=1 Tax=Solirubrobacter deserti TaxID=2282478 RepID=A0ABT4REH7_9ACTN|nr:phosphotransferase family protein [Solirubrobacter deserti]MBE2318486.1 phosphotransferase family protein [Solirubrobacter deserti]MDA0136944.1 phosphotransferase family protein [Solirubrobacter deserti]
MTAIVATPEEASALDQPPLLVLRPLERFLDEHGLGTGEITAQPVGDGHSNVTYLVARRGGVWVLRRPPRPPLPPSAHDVLREARLLRALEPTAVRVPKVVATCDDEAVIGAPFYVMERVHGTVINATLPDGATPAGVAAELVDALVEVHATDWQACGLEGFGKPTGYLQRQVRRFTGLWEHNATREIAALDEVTAWLGEQLPESGPATIVHGDYRLGNVMFTGGRLSAIFDWELATIGDPLADVGYLLATWAQEGDPQSTIASLTTVTRTPGFPTRDALVARYEERSGRSMRDLRWYTTLALWKSAIFLEGSYKRRLAGTTEDAFFDRLKEGVPEIAERARSTALG